MTYVHCHRVVVEHFCFNVLIKVKNMFLYFYSQVNVFNIHAGIEFDRYTARSEIHASYGVSYSRRQLD